MILSPGAIHLRQFWHRHSDWFNSFNHANFMNPNASIGTAPAGTIISTQPARIIQMALKLAF
jgi:hypothetical protein